MNSTHLSFFLLLFVIMLILHQQNTAIIQHKILKNRKGSSMKLPTELLKEFIGKECCIRGMIGSDNIVGVVLEVNDGWLKVEEKKKLRLVNSDYIRDISIKK